MKQLDMLRAREAGETAANACLERAERWLPIPGYEGWYEVSDAGRIRSLTRRVPHGYSGSQSFIGRLLKIPLDHRGYPRLLLHKQGNLKSWAVHRAVMAAFVPRPDWKQMHVNHKDGRPTNNSLSNLEWCTRSENGLHAYRVLKRSNPMTGRCRELHPNARPVVGRSRATGEIREFPSISATIDAGFKPSDVSATARGAQHSHRGWEWRYGTAGGRIWKAV